MPGLAAAALATAAGAAAALAATGAPAAVGFAAVALFVVAVVVASAAVLFVGIVAFRSVCMAPVLGALMVDVEIFPAFGPVPAAGLAAPDFAAARAGACRVRSVEAFAVVRVAGLVAAVLVAAGLAAAGVTAVAALPLAGALPRDARREDAFAAAVVEALAALGAAVVRAFDAVGRFAVARARAVTAGFAWRDPDTAGRAALARFTEAAGCAVDRAAALDEAAPLALPDAGLPAGFGLADAARALVVTALDFEILVFAVGPLRDAVLLAVALAALRSRAAGLVLGDMGATPGSVDSQERDRTRHAAGPSGHDLITPSLSSAVWGSSTGLPATRQPARLCRAGEERC